MLARQNLQTSGIILLSDRMFDSLKAGPGSCMHGTSMSYLHTPPAHASPPPHPRST